MSLKKKVKEFWDSNPCGSAFTEKEVGTKTFFEDLERQRYSDHGYLLDLLKKIDLEEKAVLEVGCGVGTDLRQIRCMGGAITGLELSEESLKLAKKGFEVYGLMGNFINGDAENLPFQDCSFDVVYSVGVLHHTPNTEGAIKEIHRVLRPRGTALVMLYNRNSLYYYLNYTLAVARTLGLHPIKQIIKGFATRSTDVRLADGKDNPLGKCYSQKECAKMFKPFPRVKMFVRCLRPWMIPLNCARAIPEQILDPLSKLIGWYMIVIAKKDDLNGYSGGT